jgi:hypothetical protein
MITRSQYLVSWPMVQTLVDRPPIGLSPPLLSQPRCRYSLAVLAPWACSVGGASGKTALRLQPERSLRDRQGIDRREAVFLFSRPMPVAARLIPPSAHRRQRLTYVHLKRCGSRSDLLQRMSPKVAHRVVLLSCNKCRLMEVFRTPASSSWNGASH